MTDVTIRFLGSGDAFGDGGRFQACILLDSPAGRILLDCGATSLVAMKRTELDPSSIETVLVTHLHGDHFGGLPFLILDGQFSRRQLPLRIVGPPGVRERVEAAMEVFFSGSSTIQRRFPVDFVEFADRTPLALGPIEVTPVAVDHASGAPAFALRVRSSGKTVAYSGDTAWTDALVELASGADLFIAEAYTAHRPVRFHLDYDDILAYAGGLTARRIILTHMGPSMLALPGAAFERAYDGLTITL